MAFFRKAGSMLRGSVSTHISQEISQSKQSILEVIRCMSTSRLFVGGLSYNADDIDLREAFDKYGEVAEAKVIVDRETGRSRGFGFVTYSSMEEASAAIQALDQQDLHGRRIRVNYANERTRGFGGGGYGSGNFGAGGNFVGSGFGGSNGTGGGYNNNYGYGGNYGSGGYSGGGGGSNFNSGVNSYGSGAGTDCYPASGESTIGSGNHASSNSYGGGNLSYGGDDQNIGVAGGAGGSDNFFSSVVGADSDSANSGYELHGDNFGGAESNSMKGAGEGLSQVG